MSSPTEEEIRSRAYQVSPIMNHESLALGILAAAISSGALRSICSITAWPAARCTAIALQSSESTSRTMWLMVPSAWRSSARPARIGCQTVRQRRPIRRAAPARTGAVAEFQRLRNDQPHFEVSSTSNKGAGDGKVWL
jgi:hypothetical protein